MIHYIVILCPGLKVIAAFFNNLLKMFLQMKQMECT